jgi:glucosyl-3-phosphoglycerate synthase
VPVGYGVETAMLIDVWRRYGLDAMAQVDLGTRQNRHQSLRVLGGMALEVLTTALARGLPPDAAVGHQHPTGGQPGGRGGVEPRDVPLDERPPMAAVLGARR